MDALYKNVLQQVEHGMPTVDTVFVGGGTPSFVDPELLIKVIRALPLSPRPELSIECNPDNVSDVLMSIYANGGVTRISLGVQSMSRNVLQILGRQHNPENVEVAVACAKGAGIGEINLDLIYGSVGETLSDVEYTIDRVLALEPTHVSAYGLTVEPGTPLSKNLDRYPDDDDEADKYLFVNQRLETAGFYNYEISNWSRVGSECRHNLLYWRQGNYIGFGCAAHSHLNGRRWWNVRTPERFIDLVDSGGDLEASSETLDAQTQEIERLQLALRMRSGVKKSNFSFEDLARFEQFLEIDGEKVTLRPEGRLLANEIALYLQASPLLA